MFVNDDPFWFVASELLTKVFHAELDVVTQLLVKHSDLSNLFDAAEATAQQRTACFALLAHFKLFEIADEQLTARYEESPSLDDVESKTLKRIYNLVPADAPAWVHEVQQVVEQLPIHIYTSLPETLRRGGYNPEDAEQIRAIESAKMTFSSVEQIQILTERVIDQQLKRLQRRWPPAQNGPKKPKHWLKGTQGLTRKADLSLYKNGLTERQELAFSLKWEYGLGLTEIASRMGINHKTAYEHIEAAKKKMEEAISNEKSIVDRAKSGPDF
jgi:hypothetical protein